MSLPVVCIRQFLASILSISSSLLAHIIQVHHQLDALSHMRKCVINYDKPQFLHNHTLRSADLNNLI